MKQCTKRRLVQTVGEVEVGGERVLIRRVSNGPGQRPGTIFQEPRRPGEPAVILVWDVGTPQQQLELVARRMGDVWLSQLRRMHGAELGGIEIDNQTPAPWAGGAR